MTVFASALALLVGILIAEFNIPSARNSVLWPILTAMVLLGSGVGYVLIARRRD
ncbi:MAG: hypothetical protein V4479_11760 [Actinomycetota bacterium]